MKRTILVAALFCAAASARANPAAVERGFRLAQANCSPCHAIGAAGDSPNAFAPRFRDLGALEPDRSMEEIFAKGLLVGHPDMPRFGMRGPEQNDILAYLATMRRSGARPGADR